MNDKEYKKKEMKSQLRINEIESNKSNDISISRENESFITDEIIQYCSSPKGGLVSINISDGNNKTITPIPSDKNNITNTITMTVAMIKKEIILNDCDKMRARNSTFHKDVKEKEKENKINRTIFTNKNNKCKSIFKSIKKNDDIYNSIKNRSNTNIYLLDRKKINFMNIEVNHKKKSLRIKRKKKGKKSKEKYEENKENEKNEKENGRLSIEVKNENENENKNKKKKKKKIKKSINKKRNKEDNNEEIKNNEKQEKSPNIIILDFSTSGNNNDESYDSDNSDNNNKSSEEKEQSNKNKEKNNNKKIEFYTIRQKSNEIKETNNIEHHNVFYDDKQYVTPKTRQSGRLINPYSMSQTKIRAKPNSGKIISNIDNVDKTKIQLKSKSICFSQNKNNSGSKEKKKDKTRNKNGSYNIFKAHTKRYLNKKEEEKKNTKNSIPKNNIFTNNTTKKVKNKSKEKDSFKSSKFLRKQLKPFITNNFEKEKCYKIKDEKEKEKDNENENENMKFYNKSNKNLGFRNSNDQTKSQLKKNAYNSNRNITKIALSHGKGLENKDIYLVFEGRQETIINYTNQEMVDDENEYMIE